jgi:serine/threonine protein kinase
MQWSWGDDIWVNPEFGMNQRETLTAAFQFTDPAERAAFLEQACRGDAKLRQRVGILLRAHDSAGDFLDRPAVVQLADDLSALTEIEEDVSDSQTPVGNEEGTKSPGAAKDEALSFLQPSSKPGTLGRLGHYEVLEVLGRGGFAIVVRAFDEVLQRVVAIKVLSAQMALTSPARKRFLREARASAAVRDDHVVPIHAVEEHPRPYLVMEYIPGQTLQQKLDATGPLETSEMLRLAVQIARGLAAAHAQGLIHRDIKPSNILLEPGIETKVKITDFGLARTADDASLTQSGVIAGTPLYMAPEQALGEPIDYRADLFSLGSVLYVMLTGRPPFRAPSALAVLKRVCDDTPRPICEIIPEAPPWLCELIGKLHAKKPQDRFQTAQEVADLLAQPPVGADTMGWWRPGWRSPAARPRRRKWLTAAVLLLSVGLPLGLIALCLTNPTATILRLKGDGPKVDDPPTPPDAKTAKLKKPLIGHKSGVISVAYSPNGRLLASGDKDGEVLVWNMPDGTSLYPLPANGSDVHALAFSPDGKFLLTASARGNGDINIWDAETGKPDGALKGHTSGLFEFSFGPDGKTLVSAGWEPKVRVWDFAARREVQAIDVPGGQWIRSVVVSADGKIAVGSGEKVFLFKPDGQLVNTFDTKAGPLCFSPDGRLLAGTTWTEGRVTVWDVGTGKKASVWRAHEGLANGVAFSGDGRVLVTAGSDGVRLWDVATQAKLGEVRHDRCAYQLAFSPDGTRIPPSVIRAGSGCAYQLAFSPDGTTLATTGEEDHYVKLWDISFLRSLKPSGKGN